MWRMSMGSVRPQRDTGYALLEALIAVIVAAVGFIGAARMQTFGMQLSNSAEFRQKATLLAYEMADRIRANRSRLADTVRYANEAFVPTTGRSACIDASCTADALAGDDVLQWRKHLSAQLPSGQGTVCFDSDLSNDQDDPKAGPGNWKCDGVPSGAVAIKISWSDRVTRPGTVGTPTLFVTVVRP